MSDLNQDVKDEDISTKNSKEDKKVLVEQSIVNLYRSSSIAFKVQMVSFFLFIVLLITILLIIEFNLKPELITLNQWLKYADEKFIFIIPFVPVIIWAFTGIIWSIKAINLKSKDREIKDSALMFSILSLIFIPIISPMIVYKKIEGKYPEIIDISIDKSERKKKSNTQGQSILDLYKFSKITFIIETIFGLLFIGFFIANIIDSWFDVIWMIIRMISCFMLLIFKIIWNIKLINFLFFGYKKIENDISMIKIIILMIFPIISSIIVYKKIQEKYPELLDLSKNKNKEIELKQFEINEKITGDLSISNFRKFSIISFIMQIIYLLLATIFIPLFYLQLNNTCYGPDCDIVFMISLGVAASISALWLITFGIIWSAKAINLSKIENNEKIKKDLLVFGVLGLTILPIISPIIIYKKIKKYPDLLNLSKNKEEVNNNQI